MNSVISPANASWLGRREAAQGRPGRPWSKRSDGRTVKRRGPWTCRSTRSGARFARAIDASLLVLGHPSGKIRDLLAGRALNLVPVDGPKIDALVAAAPYLKKSPIPANAYGLPSDVPSFGVNAILMTIADMDARAVSDFASSLGTEIKTLQNKNAVLENLAAQDIVTEALPRPCIRRPWKCTGSWDS
jgi:TRAP-type uncharacterized transport system substrate-binding protein